jgi:serine/threonine protein kinase
MNELEGPPNREALAPKGHHTVFIAYASEDRSIAMAICAALEAEGTRCWIAPRNVQGGTPYSGQITQAIREARVLLLVLSRASNRSKQVLDEVERAAHCQNHLLAFRIEGIAPGDDLAYFFGADHWVDGFRPLPPSAHFPTLIQHTRALLQSEAAESTSEADPDAMVPSTFAHFQILRRSDGSIDRLGKGGMGTTYKAIDAILNRPVALKVISAELLNSPQVKERFLREAQAAALIHHPHVATIFQFGQQGDTYFYAMEYVEGENLERYVARQGPLSPATSLRVVLQVAQALEAAQARELVHRDIKPANIMALANRAGTLNVKLIDFGLAKGGAAEALDVSKITRTLDFIGSPAFASPEQCETKKLDIRSDIYSLGITLWYLLTGKRPFSGTVGEVMIAQATKPPPFDQLAQTPEPVVELIRKMIQKKPGDRFQTPEELQEAVERVALQLSKQFEEVPERIAPKSLPAENALPSAEKEPAETVALQTHHSLLLDTYLTVDTGTLVDDRYLLIAEEREGNGGRLFKAREEKALPGQPSIVAIKLLHPGIGANRTLLDLLENELDLVRKAAHPHLVRYDRLERSAIGPYLVREWINGVLLYDLLRWRRSFKAYELVSLLDLLPATLDFVAGQGLGLANVSVRKLIVACPETVDYFEALARGKIPAWNQLVLKLNPLSLAPLLFRTRNGWDLQTIIPASRILSITQAEAGVRGTKAVRLYAKLIHELLSGRPQPPDGDPKAYAPLPELDEAGNEILKRAFIARDSAYKTCAEFWNAFKESLATSGRPAVAVLQPPPPPSPTPKRSPFLAVAAIVAAAAIIWFVVLAAIQWATSSNPVTGRTLPATAITPSPSVTTITSNPTAVAQSTITASNPTPTPRPSITESPTAPPGPKLRADAVYEGTIHVKNDSSTNVPLTITLGGDLKSGTMTQSGRHGDLVVNFTGIWDAATLHAVTDEVVSRPKGIQWEPESFSLRFAEDGNSVSYECIADGKIYVADLSLQAAPPVKTALIYKGIIHKRDEKGSETPLTINLSADRRSGTMTQGSKYGDTIVRFNGRWEGEILRAVTGEVISKPPNIQWKSESFTLNFADEGKRASYECNSEGHLYEAELLTP